MSWSILDWIVVAAYLGFLEWLGYFFSARRKNSDDYFVGGQKIPSWVAAFSVYATAISSISYVAVTSNVYKSGWMFSVGVLGVLPLLFLVAHFFIPFIRRLNCITAYEYLENRFHRSIRLLASAIFIIFHIFRIAIVIYIPALAFVEVLPSINPLLLVAIMGFFCVVYTTVGGFEAVVWSDTIQTIILIFGAILVMIYGFSVVPAGQNAFTALQEGGLVFPKENFSFDPSKTTVWWLFIGGFFGSIYQYIGSQDVVQRYSSTKNLKEAQKTLYLQVPLLFTSLFMFIGMGSAIFIYYKFSGVLAPDVPNNAILPSFVINELPVGVSGLVIAAIFAAAQSTVSSSLNSASTCAIIDFITPIKKSITDDEKIKYAQGTSWTVGILGTLIAMNFILAGQNDMYILFNSVLGLLGSPIAGIFLLGIFFPRANHKAAWAGFIASAIVSIYIGNPAEIMNMIPNYVQPKIFGFLFAPIVLAVSLVVGYLTSLFLQKSDEAHTKGLTFKSLNDLSDIK